MANVIEYIKNKRKNKLKANEDAVAESIVDSVAKENQSGRKGSSKAVKTIATLLTTAAVATSATGCATIKGAKKDWLEDIKNPNGTNPPIVETGTTLESQGPHPEYTTEGELSENETTFVPEGDQDTAENYIERIENALESKYNLSDIELQAISTVLDNGVIRPQHIDGNKYIFVNYLVNENGNSFELNVPVPIESYTKAGKVISPSDHIIDITNVPQASNTVLNAITQMTEETMTHSQGMEQ